MPFKFNALRFAGIYVALMVLVAVLGSILAQVGVSMPSVMGLIAIMASAMGEAQLVAKGLDQKPTAGLWLAAIGMAGIIFAISLVLSAGMILAGLMDLAVFHILSPLGWTIVFGGVFILSTGMAHAGIRMALNNAFKTASRNA